MNVLDDLLESDDPSICYKARVNVLGESARSKKNRALRDEIAHSPRALTLLSNRKPNGETQNQAYSKWHGAHWVLYALALLDYPPGDTSLLPLREQAFNYLFSDEYTHTIRRVQGITRIHASIDANAIWYLHTLGLADERVDKLVKRLVELQWADGGWNCDVRSTGKISSFNESLLPLRALVLHARITGDTRVRAAAERCAEIFLKRQLFKRVTTGAVMNKNFLVLHYPCYWHYDILSALEAMWRGGWLADPRCAAALDLLESKALPDGGWPAESKFYQHTMRGGPGGRSSVDWGPTGTTRRNDFVTVDALAVLRGAGRFKVDG